MSKLARALAVLGLSGILVGCTHTVVGNGGGDHAASPDGRFRLAVEIHGANGKAYVAETKKRVFVWVLPNDAINPVPLLRTNYTFRAAGLKWRISWLSTNRVSMELVDYGPGVSSYARHLTVTNHIARLIFVEHDGMFVEEHQ